MHTLILLLGALTAAPAPAPPTPVDTATRPAVLIVANQGDQTVHLVDLAGGATLARIPSSPAPHEVAVTADGRWAVVSNYGGMGTPPGHTLTVVDVPARAVARTIELAPYAAPHDVEFLPGDTTLAVTVEASQAVVLVDFASGRVKAALSTLQQGTHMMAIAPGAGKVYTANVGSGTVSELEVATGRTLRTYAVGPMTEGIALSPDGTRLWAASMGRDSLFVFDTGTGARVAALPAPGHAYRITITPDGRHALIPAPQLGVLRVVDTATFRETAIAVPYGPGAPVVSPDGRTAYVPVMGIGKIAVIDLAAGAVTGYLNAGAGPDGMALAPAQADR